MKSLDDDVKMGSERSFGLVFAALFAIIGLWPLWHSMPPRLWALAASIGFLLVAFIAPAVLKPLNVLWFKFGLLVGRIMTPIVMSLIYGLTVVPIGIIMRLLGKDLLRLGLDRTAKTYWIVRETPGPQKGSMKQQF